MRNAYRLYILSLLCLSLEASNAPCACELMAYVRTPHKYQHIESKYTQASSQEHPRTTQKELEDTYESFVCALAMHDPCRPESEAAIAFFASQLESLCDAIINEASLSAKG